MEYEDDADADADRRNKLVDRALRMKIYGRNVQLDASLYSDVISNAVATMSMGLQASESNTSEVIKVFKYHNLKKNMSKKYTPNLNMKLILVYCIALSGFITPQRSYPYPQRGKIVFISYANSISDSFS